MARASIEYTPVDDTFVRVVRALGGVQWSLSSRAIMRPSGSCMHVDHLGSVDVITNGTGTVEDQRSYDAFGGFGARLALLYTHRSFKRARNR
jgi:hypothetical protein